jgi:hypothetical protein
VVSSVVAPASVPAGLLAEPPDGGEDRVPEAFTDGLRRLFELVLDAARPQEGWLERIRAGLTAALVFLDEHPQWAQLLVLEAPLQGAAVRACTRRVQDALGEVLEHARGELILGTQLMPPQALIAELLLGALLSLTRARMLRGKTGPLVKLAPSLMRHVVEPYLGRGAAKADRAGAPAPAAPVPCCPQVLPIRATPTYMLALSAIVARPHSSSREIDAATGPSINDGNIAQLLGRLARRGLIENVTPCRAPGDSNAWLITPYGRRVLQLNDHALPPRAARSNTCSAREAA